MSFLADYSVQYQGCAIESQWLDGAIITKHLVHYSLCQSGCDCTADSASTGEYIVSLQTFAQASLQHICNNCGDCNDDGGCDDQDCSIDDDSMLSFCDVDYENYLACQQIGNNDDEGRRFLEQQNNPYLSAYCDVETSTIQLGVYSDDTCTTLTDDSSGFDFTMPNFGDQCLACNDELCETVYPASGKCETSSMNIDNPSDDSCSYIRGLFQTQKSGISTAPFTIFALVAVAVAATGYAFYSYRHGRSQITLESSGDGLITYTTNQ